MSAYVVSGSYLSDIADAIRAKTGTSDTMTIDEMPQKIIDISGGNFDNVNVTAADVLSPKIFVDKEGNEQFGTMPTNNLATPSVQFNDGVFTSTVIQATGYVAQTTSSNSLTIPDSWVELNFEVVGGTTQPSGGGDTLTWDGNTEGLVEVNLEMPGMLHYKVSDVVLSAADVSAESGSSITLSNGQTYSFTAADIIFDSGIGMHSAFYFVSVDTSAAAMLGCETGTYLMKTPGGEAYVSSITIPGYTGFGSGAPIKENTIWVNTDAAITEWEFSATEPTGVAGKVWFPTGSNSQAPFNALKKNSVTVYPLTAKQYVNGAWVYKTAMIYQNGAWTELWNGVLYDYGDQYEHITGGWVGSQTIASNTTSGGKLTVNEDNLSFTNVSGGSFGVVTTNAIDLTSFTTIHAITTGTVRIQAATVFPSSSPVVYSDGLSGTSTEHSVDISAITGSYKIAVNNRGSSGSTKLHRMWLT